MREPEMVSDTCAVAAVIAELTQTLALGGVCDAPREARDLLAAVLGVARLWPSVNGDADVSATALTRARAAANLRVRGAPFAYAVGRAAFRHLLLDVDSRVLIPRQETEVLVDEVLARCGSERARGGVVADIGTGSGAIALALAQEGWFDRVIATDISLGALEVARGNARRLTPTLRATVEFRSGSLVAPIPAGAELRAIVANPPYIAFEESGALPASVRDWEPPVALYSADGGMRATIAIVRGSPARLARGGLLALEVDSGRAALVAELAASDGRYRDITVRLDLTGRERFVLATRNDRALSQTA